MGAEYDISLRKVAFTEYPITEDLTFSTTPALSKWSNGMPSVDALSGLIGRLLSDISLQHNARRAKLPAARIDRAPNLARGQILVSET